MATEQSTTTIKVRSIEFGDTAFRKLRGLKIEFSERITLIAGHNGIGKSTILGLVANTFGLAETGDPITYSGDPFYTNVEKIVYLALAEVESQRSSGPIVAATVNDVEVYKRCSMTQRTEWKRARVVPRTVSGVGAALVKQDGKIRLPTIYLGIRRLAPVGEAEEGDVNSRRILMEESDRQVMMGFVADVIQGVALTDSVTRQSIKGIRKRTAQPGYKGYESLAVSLGQDSLASIAAALASFNQLKRDMGTAYPGGLLVIDELDAGFHPHAINRLVAALKSSARKLKLQVIATTHSPRLIEALHPEGDDRGQGTRVDSVVYLIDTKRPRLADDQSLAAILDDMAMRVGTPNSEKPSVFAHFEDEEGSQFFDSLFPGPKRGGLGRRLGVQIVAYPLGIGGSHLVGLPAKDPIFRNRLLVVDADTKVPGTVQAHGNVVKLPRAKGATGTERSPENTIRLFLLAIADAVDGPLHEAMRRFNISNPTTDKILATFFSNGMGRSSEREKTKVWWITHWKHLKQWRVIEVWASLYPTEVQAFQSSVEIAVTAIATRISPTLASATSSR